MLSTILSRGHMPTTNVQHMLPTGADSALLPALVLLAFVDSK